MVQLLFKFNNNRYRKIISKSTRDDLKKPRKSSVFKSETSIPIGLENIVYTY